jgi:hypothetical protein
MLNHTEFTFRVIAPFTFKKCVYANCKEVGSYAAHVTNDSDDKVIAHYDPLCEKHLLFVFVDSFEDTQNGVEIIHVSPTTPPEKL